MKNIVENLLLFFGLLKVETFCVFRHSPYFSTRGMPGQSLMICPASVSVGIAERRTYFGRIVTDGSLKNVARSTIHSILDQEELASLEYRAAIEAPWATEFLNKQFKRLVGKKSATADSPAQISVRMCKETGVITV